MVYSKESTFVVSNGTKQLINNRKHGTSENELTECKETKKKRWFQILVKHMIFFLYEDFQIFINFSFIWLFPLITL